MDEGHRFGLLASRIERARLAETDAAFGDLVDRGLLHVYVCPGCGRQGYDNIDLCDDCPSIDEDGTPRPYSRRVPVAVELACAHRNRDELWVGGKEWPVEIICHDCPSVLIPAAEAQARGLGARPVVAVDSHGRRLI